MKYTDEFPILKEYTYLNTASSGLLSNTIAKWRTAHDAEFLNQASIFRLDCAQQIQQTRINISSLFNVKIQNTFLVPNFSFGFNALLNGLEENHRFLILKEDYPSLSFPITSMGLNFKEIDIDEQLETNIISAIETYKPTIFAFSMVQYISGIRISPAFIQQLKTSFPELLLIADGTQLIGTCPFDFEKSGLDALVGSSYKWLLGGYGNGYVFISDSIRNYLYTNQKNNALPSAPFLAGREFLSLCFEPGHMDTLNYGTLNQSLNYLNAIGLDKIEAHTQEISKTARIALNDRGYIADYVLKRDAHSAIMGIRLNQEMVEKIQRAKILDTPRGEFRRFSFHFYNTDTDVQKLIDVLDGKC
ncbi:aminotransferase class V-fold PLP-dependent enzyme [Pedobacter sp. AW1-32]|uniref:aminotransferase class V-fold PLP-dependent enzyme n=1 Tax=Pedobacter sp. AW1-32 TaxID=3383026 RepID=UPI003FEE8490